MSWARLSRSVVDGQPAVIKSTDYDARIEAEGLAALGSAGVPVPTVISASTDRLVLSEVSGTPDWEELGRALARCHRITADAYGYDIDNFLGPLNQVNAWSTSWPDFYVENRLKPHMAALPPALRARLATAVERGWVHALLEHGQSPSLIHGDLWSGNIVDGSWMIDPAVHYADREIDLAFATVFGGIPPEMWRAYEDMWPLDEGWRARRPALQLYHLTVHVRLFGAGYHQMVADRLDTLGW